MSVVIQPSMTQSAGIAEVIFGLSNHVDTFFNSPAKAVRLAATVNNG